MKIKTANAAKLHAPFQNVPKVACHPEAKPKDPHELIKSKIQ
jgi:hypothetical protein